MSWIEDKLDKLIDQYGTIPYAFSPYHLVDCTECAIPVLTTYSCGSYTARGGC